MQAGHLLVYDTGEKKINSKFWINYNCSATVNRGVWGVHQQNCLNQLIAEAWSLISKLFHSYEMIFMTEIFKSQ